MRYVHVMAMLLALGLWGALLVRVSAAADEKSHEGVVVSAGDGKLVMTDASGGKEHSHKIGPAAKITVDGKAGKLEDLRKGMKIRVTMQDADVVAVSTIDTK